MNQASRKVNCAEHGEAEISFVCIHIAKAIDGGEKVGFFWSEAEEGLPPIAWCGACEDWLLQNGEEWSESFKSRADFKLICAGCFTLAKQVIYGS
ncbi:hypothetical protein [Noviherbaspirillum massiliense]|uniref:hypothetical protein n=1 Tax=Noviherbaspirillum massiliense TaxID=1465823 RepID=UPI00036C533D|nr:hypothetical protein [Noviherbaspirillum massiliense]